MKRGLVLLTGILLVLSQPAFSQQAWYEGGTLQKGTVDDWSRATQENQLATSADFITSLNNIPELSTVKDQATMDEMYKKSEDLRQCVNLSIKPDTPNDQPIAQLIVSCTVLKGK
jgi:hypothetical protein